MNVLSLTILNWKIWSACFYQRTIYQRLWKVSVNDFENKFRRLLYQKILRKLNAIDETIYLNLRRISNQTKKKIQKPVICPFSLSFHTHSHGIFCVSTKLFEPKQLADQWFIIWFVLFYGFLFLSVSFAFVCTIVFAIHKTNDSPWLTRTFINMHVKCC